MSKSVSFIGLGKMGTAMVEKLLETGVGVTVFNRTIEKAQPLAARGATIASSLRSAVKEADIIFTSLLDDTALSTVSSEILAIKKPNLIHVSTSTILPKTATQLENLHRQSGNYYIAAPVLGVPDALREKQAMTICAGDQEMMPLVISLVEAYSDSVMNLGKNAADASVFKICMNYSLVSAIELISELYAFSEKSGLDTTVVQEALKHLYSHPSIHRYIDKIHDRNFDQVNFDMYGGNKDINLFQQAFNDVGVIPDIANMVRGKFTEALANGMGDKDWSAIGNIIRQRSGLD